MFKYWSLKKYVTKLLPLLEKQYGVRAFYSASQIRETIFKKDFDPKFLPLGYILFLERSKLLDTMSEQFPDINISEYKKEILLYLERKSYRGSLTVFQ